MTETTEENLVQHLEALRSMLLKCLMALSMGLLPVFFISPYCLDGLIKIIIGQNNISLNYFSPLEVFILQIKIAVVLDFLLCFPYMARQVWKFLLPALYENEQKFIKSIVLISSALFISGAVFCVFFILPLIVNFGISFATSDIKALFGVSNLIGLAMRLAVIFGLMFQFPLITYSLIKTGICSWQSMKTKRPYVFVSILIVAGILTPPDVVSQLILTIPTYLLFEIGLVCAKS